MSKINYIILLFLLFQVEVNAQIFTGTIYDRVTKVPIADAHIYLNGSSYFTITSDSGTYHLEVREKLNTQMIISHLLYETFVIDQPFDKEKTKAIYLTEKENMFDEVVIKPKFRFSRREMMNAFETQFLGNNREGKSCKILNKDDIQLFYNDTVKTLYAKCNQPIIVENEFLGYQIQISLNSFYVRYKHHTLKERDIELLSLFRGNMFFVDMAPHNPVIKKRRDESYQSSSRYFFKSMANNVIKESNLIIFNSSLTKQIDYRSTIEPEHYFDIIDKGSDKLVRIKPNTNINKNTGTVFNYPHPPFGVIAVSDHKGGLSEIVFLTDEFTVDKFGIVIDKSSYIYLSGQMYNLRVGNMVPMDYE